MPLFYRIFNYFDQFIIWSLLIYSRSSLTGLNIFLWFILINIYFIIILQHSFFLIFLMFLWFKSIRLIAKIILISYFNISFFYLQFLFYIIHLMNAKFALIQNQSSFLIIFSTPYFQFAFNFLTTFFSLVRGSIIAYYANKERRKLIIIF